MLLNEVYHNIFDLYFFHDSNPDKQAKVFSNSGSISPRYSITKFSLRSQNLNIYLSLVTVKGTIRRIPNRGEHIYE